MRLYYRILEAILQIKNCTNIDGYIVSLPDIRNLEYTIKFLILICSFRNYRDMTDLILRVS